MKKIRKLAVIRDNDTSGCPFGLPIPEACQNAGESVNEMQLVSDNDETIINYNYNLLLNNPEPKKCQFALHLFKNHNVVDCGFGDTSNGEIPNISFKGSPYYTKNEDGLGMGGFLNYPVRYQTDGSEYRNIYYGIYNWASDRAIRTILRQTLLAAIKDHKS